MLLSARTTAALGLPQRDPSGARATAPEYVSVNDGSALACLRRSAAATGPRPESGSGGAGLGRNTPPADYAQLRQIASDAAAEEGSS
jgi:hypothetical protein